MKYLPNIPPPFSSFFSSLRQLVYIEVNACSSSSVEPHHVNCATPAVHYEPSRPVVRHGHRFYCLAPRPWLGCFDRGLQQLDDLHRLLHLRSQQLFLSPSTNRSELKIGTAIENETDDHPPEDPCLTSISVAEELEHRRASPA